MADGDVTGKVTRKTLYTLTFLANIKEKQLIHDAVRVKVAKATPTPTPISLFVKRVDKIEA